MVHIFVSHAEVDNEIIDTINDKFQLLSKINLWIDHKNIQPGEDWNKSIEKVLKSCDSCFLLLTKSSCNSQECTNEWRTILNQGKKLYVAIYGILENFPWRLRTISFVDLTTDFDMGIETLIKSIENNSLPLDVATPTQLAKRQVGRFIPFVMGIVAVTIILSITLIVFQKISERFFTFLANLLGIKRDDIKVKSVISGSVIITLEMPREAANLLIEITREDPELFAEYNLVSVYSELLIKENLNTPITLQPSKAPTVSNTTPDNSYFLELLGGILIVGGFLLFAFLVRQAYKILFEEELKDEKVIATWYENRTSMSPTQFFNTIRDYYYGQKGDYDNPQKGQYL